VNVRVSVVKMNALVNMLVSECVHVLRQEVTVKQKARVSVTVSIR